MTANRDKKRKSPTSIRLTDDELAYIDSCAEKAQMSRNAFIKFMIFGQEPPRQSRRSSMDKKHLAKLLSEAGNIRQLLHEISRSGGCTPNNTILTEKAVQALLEIRSALLKAMGRSS